MKKHINEYIYSYDEDAWIQDEFFNDVVNNQKELPGEFAKLVHDNFWNLVNTPKKKKVTGVLGEMIANMNQESLQKTRKEMIAEVEQQIKKCIGMILTDADEQRFEDFDVTLKECIDWLEKQESVGEIVSRCKDSWYNKGKIDGMVEGLTDDEKYHQGWYDALEKQGKQPTDKVESKKLNADEVIGWLKNTIKQKEENYGVYKETHLILPYNSIEHLINDFKEDFGLC